MLLILKIITFILLLCFNNAILSGSEYKFAVRALHGIEDAYEKWLPTLEALNQQFTDHTFILVPIISLNEISERVARDEFDFILTNPSSFVEINKLYDVKPLVTLNNKRANSAQTRFGSVIFTHVMNKDILSISDLKGKTLMAVSEPAFGGWRVAWLEMLNQGFDPYKDLKKLMFTKSGIQPDVVFAVRDHIAEVGVVRTDRLERMETAGEIDLRYFRIINNKSVSDFPFFLSTTLYPEWVVAARHNLPSEVSARVKKILLSLHPVTAAAKAGKYMGWVEVKDYSSVERLMKRLKVGPYASK